VADLGVWYGGGPNGGSFGNRRGTRGGSREGDTPPWVRGPGRSPGSFRIYRSLYVSFNVLWQNKWLQISGVLQGLSDKFVPDRSSYSYLDRLILHRGDPPYTSVCNIIPTAIENGSIYGNEIKRKKWNRKNSVGSWHFPDLVFTANSVFQNVI